MFSAETKYLQKLYETVFSQSDIKSEQILDLLSLVKLSSFSFIRSEKATNYYQTFSGFCAVMASSSLNGISAHVFQVNDIII